MLDPVEMKTELETAKAQIRVLRTSLAEMVVQATELMNGSGGNLNGLEQKTEKARKLLETLPIP